MRFDKLQYNSGYQAGDNEVRSQDHGEFLYRVIGNAGLVPFRLIFGDQPGEGSYPDVGAGITDLLGVVPGDFTEKAFKNMIEKTVSLSDGTPSNILEAHLKFRDGRDKEL